MVRRGSGEMLRRACASTRARRSPFRDAARLSRDLSQAALALLCDPFALGMLSCRLAAFRTMFNFLMT